MSDIVKINNIAIANVAKVNNIAKASLSKVLGQTVPAAGPAYTTDQLFLFYDPTLESIGATTLTNRVDSSHTGTLFQDGHDATTIGNPSVAAIDSTQAMYLDGSGDTFWKRAMISSPVSGGNHGADTYGAFPTTVHGTSTATNYSIKNTGMTIECWWRTNGSFTSNGNLWSAYSNNGIRTRFSSSGVRWFYMQNQGTMSSGWGTYNTDVWYHDVTTLSAPDADGSSGGKHTLKLYSNNSLVQSLTNKSFSPSTYIRDLILFGSSKFQSGSVAEAFRGYYGLVRMYQKALSSSEITANYNAEKSRYGY